MMKRVSGLLEISISVAMLFGWLVCETAFAAERVTFQSGGILLTGYLCKPGGTGPFPLVVYNHGGGGGKIGGAPEETCDALAEAGFVGLSPVRRQSGSFRGDLDDIYAGLRYGQGLPYVDRQRIGLMGFSRGGLLTVIAATERADFRAVVVMAAVGSVNRGPLARIRSNLKSISAPVLLLVAGNDTGSRRSRGMNMVQGNRELAQALKAAGREVRAIEYPPYGTDGHTMFFEVGEYWKDVVSFLREHL